MFTKIRKRNGQIADFDQSKISRAITRAGEATGEFGQDIAQKLTLRVLSLMQTAIVSTTPHVEEIQDVVEEEIGRASCRERV